MRGSAQPAIFRHALAGLVAVLALCAPVAQAQDNPTPEPAAAAEVAATPAPLPVAAATPLAVAKPVASPLPFPSSGGGSLQLFFYLLALIGLFGGGMYLLRGGVSLRGRNKGERKLQIAETRMLGSRQFLVVAEYEDRKMLIGVCPGRIDYLCTLAGPEPEFPNLAPEKSDV